MNKKILLILYTLIFVFFGQTIYAVETNQSAPDCALSGINDNQAYAINQYKGKVIYVDFWASWCSPCAQSFPFMNNLSSTLKDRGLQIVGVNLDDNKDDALAFLTKYQAKFLVTIDKKQQCARDFDVQGMPASYLIDRKGVVRHIHLGFREDEAKDLQLLVEQLLAEPAMMP